MTNPTSNEATGITQARDAPLASSPDAVVYFLPADHAHPANAEIDLRAMFKALWAGRRLIAVVTLVFTLAGVAYALLATKWYRADVVVVPVQEDATSRLMSQFGGLANLVGVNVNSNNEAEPLGVLQSRELARDFIVRHGLMPVLFAKKWDAEHRQWIGPRHKWPDVRDGVRLFDEHVRRVYQDRKTGLVTITINWKNPKLAADWANQMVADVNARIRARTIEQSQANVDYLREQIASMNLVALQQPASRLLEMELQKLMLARSNAQYAFRVVDVAAVPKRATSPHKRLVVVGAFFLGALLASIYVTLRHVLREESHGG
jgi:uncharacterized protein involved in exopolysaccharide biosynthesis